MGKEGKRLKRCSTSTDVEAADPETDVDPKQSESKQIDEDDLEPKKKQKKEMIKLRESIKEMTEPMNNLQDLILSKPDGLPGISLKEMKKLRKSIEEMTETMKKLQETEATDTSSKEVEPEDCCFETEDADGNNLLSVFVRRLDTSLPRDDLKSALRKHFESIGCQVTRVFVPIECQTGVPLGFAFIDVDDEMKAMLHGRINMGNRKLLVMMATNQPETHRFPNFRGCRHCGVFIMKRQVKSFNRRLSQRRCVSIHS